MAERLFDEENDLDAFEREELQLAEQRHARAPLPREVTRDDVLEPPTPVSVSSLSLK